MASKYARIFVGSSLEDLNIAYAIQENLEYDADVTVWNQNIFALSETTISSLLAALNEFDYAIFVFTPADILIMRGEEQGTARDNVIFEMGLFTGKLGKNRVFYVKPAGTKNFHLPSDLSGLTPGTYRVDRGDENFIAALGTFCNKVRRQIKGEFAANPKTITISQIFKGKWNCLYTFLDGEKRITGSEVVEIKDDDKYYANGIPKFTVELITFDPYIKILEFVKVGIEDKNQRLYNKLRLKSENFIEGTESDIVEIKYIKIE